MSEDQYQKLKEKILNLGPVVPGHLREVYLRCGRKNCRCHTKRKTDWHGPYIFWDRHDGKKLASRSIPAEQVELIRHWIDNRRKLDRIVWEMQQQGLKMVHQLKK